MRRQAEGLTREYDRLLEQHARLQVLRRLGALGGGLGCNWDGLGALGVGSESRHLTGEGLGVLRESRINGIGGKNKLLEELRRLGEGLV